MFDLFASVSIKSPHQWTRWTVDEGRAICSAIHCWISVRQVPTVRAKCLKQEIRQLTVGLAS